MRRRECGIVPLWIVAASLSEYLRCNGNSGVHRVSNYAYHGIRTVPETQRKNKLVSGTEQMAAIPKKGLLTLHMLLQGFSQLMRLC